MRSRIVSGTSMAGDSVINPCTAVICLLTQPARFAIRGRLAPGLDARLDASEYMHAAETSCLTWPVKLQSKQGSIKLWIRTREGTGLACHISWFAHDCESGYHPAHRDAAHHHWQAWVGVLVPLHYLLQAPPTILTISRTQV